MYTLIVRSSFDAAHTIPDHPGKCARLHGHGYRVEAEFSGDELDAIGMLCDFGDLKDALADVLPDHAVLNEVMPVTPTAENIARWVYDRLVERGQPVSAVTIWETEGCACRYAPTGAVGIEKGA